MMMPSTFFRLVDERDVAMSNSEALSVKLKKTEEEKALYQKQIEILELKNQENRRATEEVSGTNEGRTVGLVSVAANNG